MWSEFLGDGPVRALLGTRSKGVLGGSAGVGKKGLVVDGPRWNIATQGCKTEEGCKMGFNLRRSRGQMAMDEILRGGGGGGDVDGNGAQPLTLKSGAAANYNFHPSHSSVSDLGVTFAMWA